MAQRVGDRRKWRMPCEVRVGGRRHSGFVLDVSASGLFVQTNAKTTPGENLDLAVWLEDDEEMTLDVVVARTKVVPARLLTVAQGGIGVRIHRAPEAYWRLLQDLGIAGSPPARGGSAAAGAPGPGGGAEADATDVAEPPAGARFRVRVSQVSGPRSRRVEVEAADADAAGAAALETVGEGWKVLDVEPL